MLAEETILLLQAVILAVIAGIVWLSTYYTRQLLKEAQKQTELQLRPFVIFECAEDHFRVRNLGTSPALNVRVKPFTMPPLGEDTPGDTVADFSGNVVPVLTANAASFVLRNRKVLVNDEVVGAEARDAVLAILKPPRQAGREKLPFRPEITLEFGNREGQWYFVRESLEYGEIEILASGQVGEDPGRWSKRFPWLRRGRRSTPRDRG
jgi:hypothetical protein